MPNQPPPDNEPNYGLPEESWAPIQNQPIVPGVLPATGTIPYLSGSIPQQFQLAPDLLNTDYSNGRVPSVRLMPIQANASANAASASVTQKIIEQTVNNISNSGNALITLKTNEANNSEQDLLNLTGAGTVSVTNAAGTTTITGSSGIVIKTNGTNNISQAVLNQTNGTGISIVAGAGGLVTFNAPVLIGDTGAGGTQGIVPAPPAGSAAAGKYLKADGTFAVPPGTGGAAFYQTIESSGSIEPQEPTLNFLTGFTVTDNPGNTSTDISLTGSGAAIGADAYCPANPTFSTSTSTLANKTIISLLPAAFLKNGGNSIKIGMQATGGTTIQIGQMSLFKCAAGTTTVLTTTGVNIGGNSTPIVNFPGTVYTDAISVVIDATHDYYFGVYITSGGLLACTGTTYAGSAAWPFASQQFSGNNLLLTTVPPMTSTTTLVWSAVITS